MKAKNQIPNLFVLGAPKCGTTSIVHYLGQHPKVYVSPVKEPHYFNTDSSHRYYFDESQYLKLFSEATAEHSYRCEGSVWYLYSEVAAKNILEYNPEARFVVMLRDPVTMYFSLHQELLFGGSENNPSAIAAWNLQKDRAEGKFIPHGCPEPALLQYGQVCSLGEQVRRLLVTVPRSRIHFMRLEDLKNDPETSYLGLQKFLNLNPHRLDSYEVVNKKKVRRSQTLARFFIWFTNLKKRLGIKGGLGVASAINKRNVVHDVSIDSGEAASLSPKLRYYFQEDINLLESLTGKDLTNWKGM